MARTKTIIENRLQPAKADELATSELVVTLALMLRGNYTEKASYISFSKVEKKTYFTDYEEECNLQVKHTISNACCELQIPFETQPRDTCKKRYYMWGQNLKKLLAKQSLLPETNWKHELQIPNSWHFLSSDKLRILYDLTYDLFSEFHLRKTKRTGKTEEMIRLTDSLHAVKGPRRFIKDLYDVLKNTEHSMIQFNYIEDNEAIIKMWPIVNEDISDLL